MTTSSSAAPPIPLASQFLRDLDPALRLLLTAHDCTQALGRAAGDFAVEIGVLRATGCNNNDLRWLLGKGYVDLAPGTSPPRKRRPTNPRVGRICFAPTDCFFLTEAGLAPVTAATSDGPPRADRAALPLLPCWDPGFRTLRWCGRLLKCYRQPAANQELVLAVFQQEGWPHRIDNPLPWLADHDPFEQLHDTLRRLNQQRVRLLRFRSNATAKLIFWEPRP